MRQIWRLKPHLQLHASLLLVKNGKERLGLVLKQATHSAGSGILFLQKVASVR